MKKTLIAGLLSAAFALMAMPALADDVYEVPVSLHHAHEAGKVSIADKALNHKARAVVKENATEITLEFAPLEVGGLKENINRLFLVNNGEKKEIKKELTGKKPYGVKATVSVPSQKPNELKFAFWVNAMDALKDGKEGSGEQQAKLSLDWSKATMLTKAPQKMPSQSGTKNEIAVLVKGEAVKFTNAPINQKGSVIVPLRAIFEALGAEVKWDKTTRSALANKDGVTLKLTVNQKTSTVEKDGQKRTVNLSAPAQIINGSIYVPLRFIGEAFGNEVKYVPQGNSATITIA